MKTTGLSIFIILSILSSAKADQHNRGNEKVGEIFCSIGGPGFSPLAFERKDIRASDLGRAVGITARTSGYECRAQGIMHDTNRERTSQDLISMSFVDPQGNAGVPDKYNSLSKHTWIIDFPSVGNCGCTIRPPYIGDPNED